MSIKIYINLSIEGYPEKKTKIAVPKSWLIRPVSESRHFVSKFVLNCAANSESPLVFLLNSIGP